MIRWGLEPKEGDWSRLRRHLDTILASGNREFSEYMLNWLAFGLQRPGEKRGVALCVQGAEGAGKGIVFHGYRRIYGPHGLYIIQPSHLTGKFNKHLWCCCFVFAGRSILGWGR
jgi:hypothetical protein